MIHRVGTNSGVPTFLSLSFYKMGVGDLPACLCASSCSNDGGQKKTSDSLKMEL